MYFPKLTIGQNIITYRKLKGFTQKDLADQVGMTPQNLLKIEKDIVSPKAETLEKIMKALCITPNQLFGTEQYENIHVQIPFAKNFKRLQEYLHLPSKKMANLIGVTEQDISDLISGEMIPSKELLTKICKEFMISEEELTENNLYHRNKNEIEILEAIKERNDNISNILKILESADSETVREIDPMTGQIIEKEITNVDFAKSAITDILYRLPFNELLEVYKISLDRKISNLSEELRVIHH